ncbi:uncharacterized protein LOC126176146 [Schistocerca cancellata]|uniref:uncharacterized protein LOC126176146 n=1 Tax=Schistocerca cancellata TaxID=274614 RepID=UPI002118AA2B|nr:uncharacterized protein LOC126176146 [Schistocerca cancellata]
MPPPHRASDTRALRTATPWLLLFLVLQPSAALAQHEEDPEQNENNAIDSWFGPELRLMYKVVSECSRHSDLWLCLKLKALWTLERARTSAGPLPLTSYLSLAPDPADAETEASDAPPPPDTEAQLEEQLPRDLDQKQARVDALLVQSADRLLRSRALQITLPASDGVKGKKKDKYGGMLLAAGAAMAGMFLQVAMGKIALLAGKALLVAKVALVLSTVIGLKKLVGGGGGGGGGGGDHQVIYAADGHGGGGGGGWRRRSFGEDPHVLAYSAHVPDGPGGDEQRREDGLTDDSVEDDVAGDADGGMAANVEGDRDRNNSVP